MTADRETGCTCYDETTRQCPLPGHPQQAFPPDPAAEAERELLAAVEGAICILRAEAHILTAEEIEGRLHRYRAAKGLA